jgi:hypothetical protein
MIRRLVLGIASASIALSYGASIALAAPNPNAPGQPDVECGDAGAESEPTGFGTGGFGIAEDRYAGSDDTPSLNADSEAAVSQYDVACFQFTSSR